MNSLRNITLASSFMLLFLVVVQMGISSADEYHRIPPHTKRTKNLQNRAEKEDAAFWKASAKALLQEELNKKPIEAQAKNIIFFLGDGMSIATVTAARIYKGQKANKTGEEEQLTFDRFPYTALSRTYCTDAQVADSACSATAYLCGVKTDIDTLGLDYNVIYKNCSTQNEKANQVSSIMAWAQDAKKGTGIVTTTKVTHATPAGTYAHAANRDWEDDKAQLIDGADSATCDDIAEQLVRNSPGQNFKVILGGGRAYFTPEKDLDPETGAAGRRLDGINLIEEWKTKHSNGKYVTTRDEFIAVDVATTDNLLGLFSPSHMEYFLESSEANNPTLEEMTRTAIKMLQKETNGYVLLVEGGRIDQAHHDGRAKLALEEAIQFDKAVEAALELTDQQDTLIIVTADHSHTMTINGYPDRGNNLLGLSGDTADDGKPYTTLSYANGPGYKTTFDENGTRIDLTNVDTTADGYLQPSAVPIGSETHGGDDVAIFAIGPQAHLFQGVYEQHYIAHVMAYAACVGDGLKFCDAKTSSSARPIVLPYLMFAEFAVVWFAGRFLLFAHNNL